MKMHLTLTEIDLLMRHAEFDIYDDPGAAGNPAPWPGHLAAALLQASGPETDPSSTDGPSAACRITESRPLK